MTVPHTTDSWRKASYSSEQTNCVEIALDPSDAHVRDTKAREQGALDMTARAWRALLNRM